MALSDAEHLEELRAWRDNIIAALKTPETKSAYGGHPDMPGSEKLGRMPGRAQLLAELRQIEELIVEVETRTEAGVWEVTSEMLA